MHKEKDYGSKVLAKGLVRDKRKHQIFRTQVPRLGQAFPNLPGEFDSRKKAAPCENQASCGSCWDFSVTNNLRTMTAIAGKDPGPLSKNYLLLNMGPVHEYGCNGGDFHAGRNMLGGRGPCLESLSPYRASTWGVRYPRNAPVAATAKDWVMIGAGDRPTAQELCEALFNGGKGGDLSVDIAADSSFSRYHSGIFSRTTSLRINHMVRLVGYSAGASVDKSGNALFNPNGSWKDPRGAFFWGRNNWDTDWGIDGDFQIAYGVNNVAETAMMFIV